MRLAPPDLRYNNSWIAHAGSLILVEQSRVSRLALEDLVGKGSSGMVQCGFDQWFLFVAIYVDT